LNKKREREKKTFILKATLNIEKFISDCHSPVVLIEELDLFLFFVFLLCIMHFRMSNFVKQEKQLKDFCEAIPSQYMS